MFDTHCHLNFKGFEGREKEVVERAHHEGVDNILVPGTDYETSAKAVEIATTFEGVWAAVGIHPHHVVQCQQLKPIEELLKNKRVVAVGEVGIDEHIYRKTKYSDYQVNQPFIDLQKQLLEQQIGLAIKYEKSLILHNWEATEEFLGILGKGWDEKLEEKTVFHCCEPDERLLKFAKDHKIFIGIDGDITYIKKKQAFIQNIPLELLVLETDSPYLVPEPLRSQKVFPNEPKNIKIISQFISQIIDTSLKQLIEITEANSKRLFLLEG